MFNEEFNSIISNPVALQDIPLADIKVLAERYPWCQPAQVILARKLFLVESGQFESQLHRAAMLSYDREVLYQYINQSQFATATTTVVDAGEEIPQRLVVVEEPIQSDPLPVIPQQEQELKTHAFTEEEATELLQEMIESIPEVHRQPETIEVEDLVEELPEVVSAMEIEEASVMLEEEMKDENLMHSSAHIPEEIIEVPALPDEKTDNDLQFLFDMPAYDIERELGTLDEADKFTLPNIPPEVAAEKNTEVFTDSYTGWLNRLGGTPSGKVVEQKASNAPVKVYLRKQSAPGDNAAAGSRDRLMNEQFAAELARKSIQSDDGLISETYARILVMQGKWLRATEMYRKLSLLKPQKSDYFAALIDQINKKIK